MIRVAVIGAAGRMGREVVKAVSSAEDLELVAAVDRSQVGEAISGTVKITDHLQMAMMEARPEVLVDFSHHSAVSDNAAIALGAGCCPVIGATGLGEADFGKIRSACDETGLPALYAPNFAIGAVLMMRFSEIAARWYTDVEIIEMHHERKEDAPSGTALHTAELISKARTRPASDKPKPVVKAEGALGAKWNGVSVHSVRMPGLLAHQQVMFGAPGEILTIRHDSTDRAGFMHGVTLAIREVRSLSGFVIGLDKLLFR